MWKDDKINGQGILTFFDGRKYVGVYKGEIMNGQGTFTWPDGRKYVGKYMNNNRHG